MHVTRAVSDVAIACCAVLLQVLFTDGQKMSCNIPSVPLGQTTILSCNYDENIWKSKQKIVIVHYCKNNDENPETILFNSFFDGKMEFYTNPDYVLHNSTSTIEVMIPRVTEKNVGRYVCLTLQSDSSAECTFTLSDREEAQDNVISSTVIDLQDNITNPGGNKNDDYLLALIITVTGVIATSTIIFIFFFVLRYRRSKDDNQIETGLKVVEEDKVKRKISSEGNADKNNNANTESSSTYLINKENKEEDCAIV